MPSPVFFVPLVENEPLSAVQAKVGALCDRAGLPAMVSKGDLVALKVHFGEEHNHNFVDAKWYLPLVDRVKKRQGKPFWTETSTLYRGRRSNAVDHILLAQQHGFGIEATGIPIVIADGVAGRDEVRVDIDGQHSKSVGIASGVAAADVLFVLSHATGHLAAGFGGALKNIGMGLSARKGKLYQHSVVKPWVDAKRCKGDGACVRWCPENAICIVDKKAVLDPAKCVGCGECLAMCRPGAIQFAWRMESEGLQERMVEQAWGVVKQKAGKIAYITFICDVGKDCDCLASDPKEILAKAVGIVAGTDIVAVEQAAVDLVEKAIGTSLRGAAYDLDHTIQIKYAESLGVGSSAYDLVEVSVQ